MSEPTPPCPGCGLKNYVAWINRDVGVLGCNNCRHQWSVGKARARSTDPESSHIAADKMEEGGRQSHEHRIKVALDGYRRFKMSWPTAKQLEAFFIGCSRATNGATLVPLSSVQINRRVKGMVEQGLIHTRPGSGEGKEQVLILGPDPTPLKTMPFNDTVPVETRAHLIVEDILILNDTSDKDLIDAIVEYAIDLGITKKTRSTANTRYDITWMEMVLTKLKAGLLERMPGQPDGQDIVGHDGKDKE